MPSSISSSDVSTPVPGARGAPPASVWLTAIALAGLTLIGLETFWRARGVPPSLPDDRPLWAYHRADVDAPGQLVLLGASRMQVDFAPEAFHERHPDVPVAQLAVSGRAPLATLADLADDPAFGGLVVCGLEAAQLMAPAAAGAQRDEVEYFHREWAPRDRFYLNGLRLDLLTSSLVAERLALRNPELDLRRLLVRALEGRGLPPTPYNRVRFDRWRPSDYTRTSSKRRLDRELGLLRLARRDRVVDEALWRERVAELARQVARIEARGGAVVFVRFPTSPERWREEEQLWPRAEFWDRLEAETGAATVHFRDLPGVDVLALPDGSHLDERDAPTFTRALTGELERLGLLPRRG